MKLFYTSETGLKSALQSIFLTIIKSSNRVQQKGLKCGLLLIILTLTFTVSLRSQSIAQYSFTASSGSWSALSGATTATLSGGTADDGYYNGIPIGFSFNFAGTTYTHAHVSTNGWLTLGTSSSNNALTTSGVTNDFTSLTVSPTIAPLWDDCAVTTTASDVTYISASGTAPNRVTTIQVNNIKWQYTAASGVIAYQVRLYETGKVEFVYNQLATVVSSGSASIGIASASGTYQSLSSTGVAPTSSTSVNTTSLSTKPATGQTYSWTPPVTSAQNGDWNTASTWTGGVVPSAGAAVVINHAVTLGAALTNTGSVTVSTGASLAVSATYTNNGTTTINGSFVLNSSGFASGTNFVYGSSSTLVFNNSTSYGVNASDVYWPTTSGPPNVNILQGGLTLNSGANRTVSGVFQTAAGVTLSSATLTLTGTAQINTNGFFNNAPTYGSASTLIYNVLNANYGVGSEWTGNSTTAGVGTPQNVTIQNGTTLTMPSSTRGMAGNMNITVGGLTLNTTSGADLNIAGNWSRSSGTTFTPNSRAVFFNGTTAQTINCAVSGGESFDYLGINNVGSTVTLTSAVAVNASTGDVLQLLNTGVLTIGTGGSLTLNNDGGNIRVTGAARTINFTSTGHMVIAGNKTVASTSAGALTISGTSTGGLRVGGSTAKSLDPGSGLTTIGATGFLYVDAGLGFLANNKVTFTTGSTLGFSGTGTYGVGAGDNTWGIGTTGAGIPSKVIIGALSGTPTVNINENRTAITSVTVTAGTLTNNTSTLSIATGITTGATAVSVAGGTLTNGGGIINIGASGGGNQALSLTSGAFTISSGTVNVNGNLVTSGGTFTMSNGNLNIDPNSGTLASSVGSGTTIWATGGATYAVTGGTITFVDPPNAGTALSLSNSASADQTWTGNTVVFGGASGTNTTTATVGFKADTYVSSGRLFLNNVTVSGGNTTDRYTSGPATTSDDLNITGTLTINSGSEMRNVSGGIISCSGNIVNNGTFTSIGTMRFAKSSITSAAAAQTISGPGTFQNLTASPTAKFTSVTFDNTSTGSAITFGIADVTASGTVTLTNGIIDVGNNNSFNFVTTSSSVSRTNGYVLIQGTGQMKKDFATGASSFVYHVGENTGTTEYSPFSLSFTAKSLASTIGVRPVDAIHPNMNDVDVQTDYISRYWQISNSAAGTYTYTATGTYLPADVNGTEANIKMNLWTGTSPWKQYLSSVASNVLTITSAVNETTAPLGSTADFTGRVKGASTYTWNQTGSAAWTTPANWTPSRSTTSVDDILIFDGAVTATPTVTGVPTESIGKLLFTNNANVILQSAAAVTLTITGGTGTDLDIPSGSQLQLGSTGANSINLAFSGSNTAAIAGTLSLLSNTSNNNTYTATNSVTTVTGIINNFGVITSTTSNLLITTGTYNHNYTTTYGTIPAATWTANTSNCSILGYTTPSAGSVPSGITQTFGNFTWNTTSLSTIPNLGGSTITAVGTFTMTSTGSATLRLGSNSNGTIACTNYTQTGGTIDMAAGTGAGTIRVSGTFNQSGGTITESSTGSGTIEFNGTTSQAVTPGTISNTINMRVSNPAGIAITGTLPLNASTTFTAAAGGTAVTSGTVSYSTATTLIYAATGATQVVGNEFPSTNGPVSLTINNTHTSPDVSLSGSRTITGTLTITAGRILLGNNDLTLASGGTQTITTPGATKMIVTDGTGLYKRGIPTGAATYLFPIGDVTGIAQYSPVSIQFTANSAARIIGAKVVDGISSNLNTPTAPTNYLSRYWSFSENGVGGTYNYYINPAVAITGVEDENGTVANIKAAYWNGSSWVLSTGSYSSGNLISNATGVSETTAPLGIVEWTGRDNPPISYTWVGTTNDYNTASNWSPAGIPTSSDDITINVSNPCVINSGSFTVNNVTISGTGDFQMAAGTSFTIQNDVTYTSTTPPTLNCTSTITFAKAGPLTIPAWSYGNLANASNTTRIWSGTGTTGICGAFTPGTTTTYTATVGSTVDYSSSSSQTIQPVNYYNLSNSGNGPRTYTGTTIDIANAFTPSSGLITVGTTTINFSSAGAQTIPATFYYNLTNTGNGPRTLANTGTIDIGGITFTPGTGAYTVTGSTVRFSGSTGLAIPAPVSSNNYHHLSISGSGSYSLNADVTLGGNFSQTAGTMTVTSGSALRTFNVGGNFTQTAGTFNVTGSGATAGATVTVNGNTSIFSMLMEANSSNAASTVLFQANGDVTFTGTSTSSSLDWMAGGSSGTLYNITFGIKGNFNWTGSGKPYTSGSGTAKGFIFNGTGTTASPQTLSYNGAAADYGHIFAVNSGTVLKLLTNIAIGPNTNPYNTFTVNGTLDAQNFVISGGNSTVTAINTGFTLASGATLITQNASGVSNTVTTLIKNFNSASNYELNGTSVITNTNFVNSIMNNLTISNTTTVTLGTAITVNGNLNLNAGTFVVSTNNIGLAGNITGTATQTATTGILSMTGAIKTISGATLGILTLNNAAGFSLAGTPTVVGTLSLTNGVLTTGANTLIANGTVNRTNGWVNGNLQRSVATGATSRTFDIGDASVYAPVSVVFGNVSVAGSLLASTNIPGIPPATGFVPTGSGISQTKYVNRNWNLTNTSTTFDTYSATFNFVAGDIVASANPAIFIVGKNSNGVWTNPTVGTKTATSTQITGAVSFSTFSIGEAACVPPTISNQPLATQTICQNVSPSTLSVVAAGDGLSYQWFSNTINANTGGVSISGETGSTYIPPTGSSGTLYYYCVVTGTCGTATSNVSEVVVDATVSAGTITGTTPLCIGQTTVYTTSGTTGGTWSSSNTGVASVDGNSGLITALSAGTTNIVYTVGIGCGSPVSSSQSLSVSPNANAGTITGVSTLCLNETATYTSNGDAGGVWSSDNTTIATINAATGVVTAVGQGSVVVTYSINTGCGSPVSTTKSLNIIGIDYANLQFPSIATICQGNSFSAYGQVYEVGVTEPAGQGAGIDVEFGYDSNNTSPSSWATWIPATFNTQVGNNDEYQITTGNSLSPGTYYYTFRYKLTGCTNWQYGGYPNGFWNGTSQVSGVLTVNPLPTPTITAGGPTTFCAGGSVVLTSSSASGNVWSTGATTQSITVTTSGSYTVAVTDGNGCTGTSAATVVTVNPLPTPTITAGGPTTFCTGGSVVLTSSAASSYLWSNGATTQSITATTSGSYSVVVTNSNGCTGTSAATVVTVNPLPTPTISAGGATTFCAGGSVVLTSSAASSYLWSTGVTTQSITVTTGGTYTVAVTDGNGCTGTSAGTTVTVNPLPTPTITAGGPTTFCTGGSVVLTSSASSSYLWSTGETTASITVTTGGTYTVEVTSNGCIGTSAGTTVTVNPLPTPTITAGGPTTFCTGGSVVLTSSAASSYLWSTGETTVSITVTTGGTYTVAVTNSNGCTGTSAGTTVTVNPLPTPTITAGGPTTFCAGGSVVLTSSAASSYLWSTGETTASITVTTGGTYTVAVTNSNGCTGTSAGTTVTVNPLPTPTITAGGPTTFCTGSSVVLTSSASSSYLWSNGETTQSITVTTGGTYTVAVTNSNGCTGTSAGTTVTVNPLPTPTITAGGPTTFCTGGSVVLTSSAASSYLWSTGETTASITVTTGGTYTVAVTNSNGCTGTSAGTTVTVNPLPTPTITTGGPTTFCTGGSVLLTSSAASSYLWSTGETTASITVTTGGTYTVAVTNSNGCTGTSAGTTVTVNPLPTPTITAGGPTTFCTGGSVVLTSSTASSYLWSTGETTQSITVSTSGSYTVAVTSLGCTGTSAATVVTVNPLPTPTITAGGPTTFCTGGSVVLTSSAASSYLWSTGETTQSITVTTGGTYTVAVTNSNGCTGTSAGTTVTVNPLPTPTITAGGSTTFCTGGSVVLTSSAASSYLWSNGETTQSITVTTGGTYTVAVTNSNGCTGTSAGTTVTVNPLPTPTITAGGPTTFCTGGSVVLTSSAASSYLWSTGETTQSITVTTGGTYTVAVTNSNGCTGTSAGTTVTVNPLPTPTITAGGPTTFCTGGSVVLTSSSASSYLWSTGETTQSITVTTGGTYTVAVTNSNGCTGTSAGTTVTVNPLPTPTITAGGPTTFCTGGSVVLTSSAASSYMWSTGETTQSITVITGGTYTVAVTNSNGCTGTSAGTTVTVNPLPTPTITAGGPTTFCTGGSVVLTSSAASSYLWSTGETTASITVTTGGTYTVAVTNSNGCTGTSAGTTVTVNPLPTPTITTGGPTTFCTGGSVLLTSSAASSYLWSTGETTASITVTTGGTYTVAVTNSNGCTGTSAGTTVTVNPLPTPTITAGGPTTFCTGGGVLLTSSAASSYLWSTGETTSSITVTTSGSYTVAVTNSNGCTGTSAGTTVTVNPLPTPTITAGGPTTFCTGGSVVLTSSAASSYLWSTGETTASITITTGGTYTVAVTNSNGCTGTSVGTTVTVNPLPTPTITAGGPTTFCAGGSVVLTSSAASSYLWSTGETTASITVTTGGTYTVAVTNSNGCTGTSAGTTVTVNPLPTPTITAGGSTTFCTGGSVVLTSSAASSYLWSTGETTASITVTTGGTYTVAVTNSNGCTGTSAGITVTVNPLPIPTITAGGPTTFCTGGSVVLTSSTASSYLWSTGETTASITVTTGGTYTVAVTNSNGCTGTSAGTTVTVNPLPTPTITAGGPTTFCTGGSVVLTSSTASSYLWSTGETTQSITVSTSGSYTVAVTSLGCTGTSAATVVTVNPLPTPTITAGGPTTFCTGGSVVLTSSAASSYLWSTSETTASITVTTGGTYTVEVTSNGCIGTSAGTTVTVNPLPTPTITAGGATTFCTGGSVVLTSSSASGNLWSTGATTQSITVTTSGTYTVAVTSNGCTGTSAGTTVTVNPLPTPTITAGGPTTFCTGGSVVLTSSAASSYLWSTGETTASITVTTSGTYTVEVTSNGCIGTSAGTTVTVNPLPTPTISAGGPTTFCAGGSVVLTSSAASSYLWSTGATTQSITVTTSGTYTVAVTSNGCIGTSAGTTVTVNPLPTPTITAGGPTTFCTGGSVVLTSSAASSYLWSTGATTQSITVTTSGSYTVAVTNSNGCTGTSAGTTVTVNPLPTPTITAGGPTTFCTGGSVVLTSSAASSYLWSTGETTQSITVTTGGTYTVAVTNSNGCTGTSAGTTVTVNPLPTPTITAGGPTTFCTGGSVVLTSSSASSYLWSTGETTASITVTTGGTYTVEVTSNGCIGTSAGTTVTVNPLPTPTITAGGATTFCTGGSVVLISSAASSYLWSTGETTQSITVTTGGTYTVALTNSNGCTGTSAGTTVTVNPLPTPTITAGGPTTFCTGGSVVLTSSAASSYLWSTGETTQSITVTTSGSYTVAVTNSNGCTGTSAGTTVTVNPLPTPTISAGGPTTFCAGGSVVLTSSAASSYLWSTGATTQSITVTTSGTYTVAVTSNGCTGTSAGTTVTVNPLPTPTITAGGPTTFCTGGSVVLTSSAASSYLWSTGETTASITVTTSGTYTVAVTSNGCIGTSAGTTVTVNSLPTPTITAGGPTTFCTGGSVVLTSSAASSYLWSTGATTQSITVTNGGTYTVAVTNSNGCTGTSAGTTVTVNPLPTPTITAGGPTTFCTGGSVVLTSSAASSYLWSTGATTQSITVTTGGTYTVAVTNSNGCTGTSAGTTVTVNPLPTPTITAGGATTFCTGGSVVLTSSAASSYLWSTGETTASITVTTSGTYTVAVTSNGCIGTSAGTTVTVNSLPTPTITAGGPTTFCTGGSVVLTSSAASSYLWSTGATTQSITVTNGGTYTVAVTNSNGCTGTSAGTTVTVNPLPTPTITAGGPTTFCTGGSVVLTSSAASSYLWSTGATTQSITVTTGGTYTVAVTNSNGCTGTSAGTTVTVNPLPTPTITAGGATTFCTGGSVVLTSSAGSSYLWSTGETTASITVTTGGTYTVAVTNSNGCTGTSAGTTVTVNPLPTPTIIAGGPTTFCTGGSVVLTSSSVSGNLWSTGATTQSITVSTSGTYTVAVTSNGCTGTSAGTTVTVNPIPTPTISAGGPTTFCTGGSVVLTSSSVSGNLWSTGATTQSITVSTSGTYTVEVTSNGCTGTSAGTTVTVNPIPTPTISAGGPTTFCTGGSVVLTSSSVSGNLWSTGATTQSITVSTSGTYTVEVTSNGCTGTSAGTTVTVNPIPTPTISAGGPTTFCAGGSVVLTSSSASGNLWSTGATTQSITVSTSGTYTVEVTSNGCTGTSAGTTVTVNPLPTPTISAGGPTTFCTGGSVVLTSSSVSGNLWSTGATTQSITVSTSGTYTVAVTSNGCTGTSAGTSVTVNPIPTPTISAGGPTTFCTGGSVVLTSSSVSGNLWSTGATTQSITVSTSGTYTVEVTSNGCTGTSAGTTVTVNPIPTPTISAGGPTTFCTGGSVVLTSSSASGNLWSTGETTQSITVTTGGTYTVAVTSNGCTGTSAGTTVTVNPLPTSTISASGPTTFCAGGTVTLTAAAASTYLWSPGGETTQSILVNTSGTYSVVITNSNGCTSTSAPTTVTINPCTDITISGNIKWENNNAPVKTATVDLRTLPALSFVDNDVTDVNGNFLLMSPTGGDFRIIPTKNINLLNGVTAADATRIQQHISNLAPLVGPYKRIAADVNKSNSITTYDATLITQVIANNPAALAVFNTSWRFVPTSYVFPNPNIPWNFPEKIDLTGVTTNLGGQDFIGVKLGDVNGSGNPQLKPGSPVVWTVNNQVLKSGKTIQVTFDANHFEDIAAYQFALGFDPTQLELVDIQSEGALDLTDDNFGAFNAKEGELRAVWSTDKGRNIADGTPVFTVTFKALQSGMQLSEVLNINTSNLEALAYNTALMSTAVQLVFGEAQVSGTANPVAPELQVTLLQNTPNPFIEHTTIGFVLPQACDARLRILDINGRVITEVNKSYTAGYQQESFELTGITGVMGYELTTPFGTFTRKMTAVMR